MLDVAVIGGGPAGTSCAMRLQQFGLDVALCNTGEFEAQGHLGLGTRKANGFGAQLARHEKIVDKGKLAGVAVEIERLLEAHDALLAAVFEMMQHGGNIEAPRINRSRDAQKIARIRLLQLCEIAA